MSTPQVNTNVHVATPVTGQVSHTQPSPAPVAEDDDTFSTEDFASEEGAAVGTVTDTSQSDDSFLEDQSEVQDDALVQVFNAKCLNCSHLVSFATKKYKNCHFSKGNEHCPAQSVQITIRIPIEKIVRRFIVALKTGDNERLGKLYTVLATKEPWYQERVTRALSAARQEEGV